MNWPSPDDPAAVPLGDGRRASAVDRPTSLDELKDAVVRRTAEGLAIYPQGGRTALDFGRPPGRPGAAIDTTGLARVIDYPAADMTITVEAGMTLAALQATLAEQGQRLPLDAPEPDRATIGGIYATNASGPRRLGAGRPRDLIIGIGFVDGSGHSLKGGGRVVKNVAGYDFPKLLTGSLGTLGIISHLTLKVRPRPEASALAWATFDKPESARIAVDRLNVSVTRPMAVELLNRPAAGAVGGPLGLPPADWVLAVGFEDNADAVAWQLDALRPEIDPDVYEVRAADAAGPLWTALADHTAGPPGGLSLQVGVKRSATFDLATELDPGRWSVQAHAGSGIIRAHSRGDLSMDSIAPEIDRIRRLAADHGGYLTLPRCPTEWKERLLVWGTPRPDWALAATVKRALDPTGVMNPGRFVGTI